MTKELIVVEPAALRQHGILFFPSLKPGEVIRNPAAAFELWAQHPANHLLLLLGTYSYSNSWFPVARIGRYCPIAAGVRTMGAAHPTAWVTTSPYAYDAEAKRRVSLPSGDESLVFERHAAGTVIGHDVWIGRDALLRDGISIAHRCNHRRRGGGDARCSTLRYRHRQPSTCDTISVRRRFGPRASAEQMVGTGAFTTTLAEHGRAVRIPEVFAGRRRDPLTPAVRLPHFFRSCRAGWPVTLHRYSRRLNFAGHSYPSCTRNHYP